jgi:hypothetical protein
MHNDCKKIAALVSDYIDEKLGPIERMMIEKHIAECGSCQLTVRQTKNLVSRLGALSSQSVPFDLWPAVVNRLTERQHKGFIERLFPSFAWKAVALTLPAAAAVFMAFVFRSPHPVPTVSKPAQQTSAEYRAYVQAYSGFRSAQPLSDPAAIAAATELQHEKPAVPH